MNLTPEEKAVGEANFKTALQMTRREFIQGSIAAGAVASSAMGAYYFNYGKVKDPVRVGVIGTGDEGGVLINNITPEYLQVVAIADIRPYNIWRAFNGDQSSPGAFAARMGLMEKYGYKSEDQARKHVKVYDQDYLDLLNDPNVEMVIIAVPLHLHHEVAMKAMEHGKHVLTEKLMAHNIGQCKEMAAMAKKTNRLLAVGHQRHYSVLYDDAVHIIRKQLIGDIHHIRAQWHRGNLPGHDSWQPDLPDKIKQDIVKLQTRIAAADEKKSRPDDYAKWQESLRILTKKVLDETVDAEKYGYQTHESYPGKGGQKRTALEELIRWRLWHRTGGGLMAELGSHQLDASSIFVSATRDPEDRKRAKMPISVTGVGGRHIFPADRECEDHVYCSYEFRAPKYEEDPNKKIVVTYSSINGNGFGGYGEVVMGTEGTLILDREQQVMLYKQGQTSTKVTVTKDKSGKPILDTYETGGGAAAAVGGGGGPVSRGYTEEMEHFAYCLRNGADIKDLRCNPEVATGDAIIALTSNIAMRQQRRIEFKEEWFDMENPATPEEDCKDA